jgi:plastocyanin
VPSRIAKAGSLMRRQVLLAVLIALVASACTSGRPPGGNGSHGSGPPSPTPVGQRTFAVSVDGSTRSFPLASDAFYPNDLSVHPGDTIVFTEVWSGELHTVTFGTLVDQAIDTPTFANMAAVPELLPPGRSDTVQSAAQPCFLDSGTPPAVSACPQVAQPAFNGTQAFYNSGWLSQGMKFSVHIAATTPPGNYHFEDLAHPAVSGQINVAPVSQTLASPRQVAATAAAELAQVVHALQPAAQDAASLTTTVVTGLNEVAGVTEAGVTDSFVAAFGPPQITATVGQTIAWTLYGQHALALNPPPGATGLLTRSSDGSVHVNPLVLNHTGGQFGPGGPQSAPLRVNGGTYSGTSFHNSGLLTSTLPGLITYTLQFGAPGTYTLRCLIHPSMTETINVQ